jgi:hypothetical protein
LASKHAIAALNLTRAKLHQYLSDAVNFCAKMGVVMSTFVNQCKLLSNVMPIFVTISQEDDRFASTGCWTRFEHDLIFIKSEVDGI